MIEHVQNTTLPAEYISSKIDEYLAEDAANNDLTTLGTVPESKIISGYIETQSETVFAGSAVIEYIFKDISKLEIFAHDSDKLPQNFIIARFEGNARYILTRERVLLNLLQKLCGIATVTSKYTEITKPFNIKILDSRKTTPGLRLFEKYAVTCGGGFNHRFNLETGILIKDNHIKAAGSIANAVNGIKKLNFGLPIQLEVDNLEQIKEALELGVDGFLLDNMDREMTLSAVSIVRSHNGEEGIFLESSGGINLKNIEDYLGTGIDAISIGALTHSVIASDIHLEFEF